MNGIHFEFYWGLRGIYIKFPSDLSEIYQPNHDWLHMIANKSLSEILDTLCVV